MEETMKKNELKDIKNILKSYEKKKEKIKNAAEEKYKKEVKLNLMKKLAEVKLSKYEAAYLMSSSPFCFFSLFLDYFQDGIDFKKEVSDIIVYICVKRNEKISKIKEKQKIIKKIKKEIKNTKFTGFKKVFAKIKDFRNECECEEYNDLIKSATLRAANLVTEDISVQEIISVSLSIPKTEQHRKNFISNINLEKVKFSSQEDKDIMMNFLNLIMET
jgi:hypothetical protein